MPSALLALPLLLACGDKDDSGPGDGGSSDGGSTDGGAGDGGAGDGGTDGGGGDGGGGDGGGGDGGTDGGGGDGGADLDYATGIVEVARDDLTFADWGYTWVTYEVGPDFALPFTTADGLPPRFHLIWPASPEAERDHPVVTVLHGGCIDVDSEEEAGVYGRCTQATGSSEATDIVERSAFLRLAVGAGFVVAVPENGFCDGWAGLGPEDPVDTEHAGTFLLDVVRGHLRWGQDHLSVDPGAFSLAGTSTGATATPWVATQQGDLAAVVFDSGAPDYARYGSEEGYSGVDLETRSSRAEHILGGPPWEADGATPTTWYPRYVAHSLDRGILEGGYATPTLVLHNTRDTVSTPEMYEGLVGVLAGGLPRFALHDVDHDTPAHTQIHTAGALYAGFGALRFVQGAQVGFFEAEGRAGSGWVGDDEDETADWSVASGNGARVAQRGEAGTLVELPLPADALGEVALTFFLVLDDAPNPALDAVRLVLADADGSEIAATTLATDAAAWETGDMVQMQARLATTTVAGTLHGPGRARVEVLGPARVALDLVVASWESP